MTEKEEDLDMDAEDIENIAESDESNESNDERTPNRRGVLIFGITAAISAVPLGIGSGYLLKMRNQSKDAKNKLINIGNQRGNIAPVNTKLTVFSGQKIESANIEQKALTGGSANDSEQSAVFIFSNGKNADQEIVDVYVDFDSQRSRDFLLINQLTFKDLVESGIVELRIHPVSSGTPLSIYSPEAIAETFVTAPNSAWNFLISTMQLSAEVQADKELDPLTALVAKTEELNIPRVNEESIKNGTFASWIIAVGNDEKLQTGYYPPLVYVNNIIMNPDEVDFSDTNAVLKYITAQNE